MELNYRKILVPIDFSENSVHALRYANAFAKGCEADIKIVYVIEPAVYPPDYSLGQVTFPSISMEINDHANEELSKLAKKYIDSDLKYELIIKTGKPFVEIIEAAKELDADLIIISAHGHSGMEQILFGSTSEKVIRKAPCPVLSLRDPIKGFDYKEILKES